VKVGVASISSTKGRSLIQPRPTSGIIVGITASTQRSTERARAAFSERQRDLATRRSAECSGFSMATSFRPESSSAAPVGWLYHHWVPRRP